MFVGTGACGLAFTALLLPNNPPALLGLLSPAAGLFTPPDNQLLPGTAGVYFNTYQLTTSTYIRSTLPFYNPVAAAVVASDSEHPLLGVMWAEV